MLGAAITEDETAKADFVHFASRQAPPVETCNRAIKVAEPQVAPYNEIREP